MTRLECDWETKFFRATWIKQILWIVSCVVKYLSSFFRAYSIHVFKLCRYSIKVRVNMKPDLNILPLLLCPIERNDTNLGHVRLFFTGCNPSRKLNANAEWYKNNFMRTVWFKPIMSACDGARFPIKLVQNTYLKRTWLKRNKMPESALHPNPI